QVVVLVEADRMGVGEAVGVLAPFLDVLAGLVELEQLRGRGAARRPDVAAARVDEEMLLRIDRDADGLADRVSRGHQRQRHRVVGNLRRVLFELGLRSQRGLLFRAEPAAPAAAGLRRLRRSAAWRTAALGVADDADEQGEKRNVTLHDDLLWWIPYTGS